MGTFSDSDDDLEIIGVVSSAQKTFAAAEAIVQQIDSDDDQPLGALRQSLQRALNDSQPNASSQKVQEQPHGNSRSQDSVLDKENMAHATTAASSKDHDTEIDLDNWVMQPLQRRRRQRTAAGPSSAVMRSNSPQSTSGEHRIPPQQQQQQHDPVIANSQPGIPAAAEVSNAKRRRKTSATKMPSAFLLNDDDCEADPCFEPESAAAAAAAPTATAAQKRASGSGRGGGRVKISAEEKAAKKAEEKARKEAEKIAAKLAKQAEAAEAKAAKRFETFHARKMNGSFQEYESVLVMDQTTAGTAMGLAIAAELDRRKTIAWQVVGTLPLSNNWSGCCTFCFKRRKLSEADEHMIKTASTSRVDEFVADVAPPYVQLVFREPSSFVSELQRNKLSGLFDSVQAAHPDCTLGVVVLGLKPYVQRLDNQQMRQGIASHLDWRRVSSLLLGLHLSTPGLQLRLLSKQEDAATHVINTARVLGQQPYSVENQLEACGGAGPGAASKAAAANMTADLGPATCEFAVNTLGKMHGMGGHKAWAVAKAYPSFGALIAGFQRAAASPGGVAPDLLLADLMEPAAGKAKPRRVGPAMSRRLHLLLTCEDPDAIVEGDGDGSGD